jgi:hypothetical protein
LTGVIAEALNVPRESVPELELEDISIDVEKTRDGN